MIRRRAIGIAAMAIVHAIGFLLAFLMSPPFDLRKNEPELKNFRLLSLAAEKVAERPKPQASTAKERSVVVEAAPPPERPVALPSPLPIMLVSRDVFAASDISRIPARRADSAPSMADASDGGGDDPGERPGGEKMYNPDWYREPTDAEMAYYMPKGAPRSGWGIVACRTIPDFRVEDCRELAEYPSGSGIARAVRQAAWQFRIRPPRLGGKPIMGAWVRIRFDMTVGIKKN